MNTPGTPKRGTPLTATEIAVMDLVVSGEQPKRIADHVHLSCATVRSYLYRVRSKLGAKTTPQAAAIYAVHKAAEQK
jgi:DNA-binding CsgD family transcriptional regulator